MKVLLLARSLLAGGAQRQMALLARGLDERGHRVEVAAFCEEGPFLAELRSAGVTVHGLEKSARWDLVGPARTLAGLLRRLRPDVIYSFEEIPNLAAALVRPFAPPAGLVWGVRSSARDFSAYHWTLGAAFQASRLLSRLPHRIVVNSHAGGEWLVSRGYPSGRLVVVPNGVDTDAFRPLPGTGQETRRGWGVPADVALVGSVARLSPKKGQDVFLQAAAGISRQVPGVHFACVGRGPDEERLRLQALASELDLGDRMVWDEGRTDMPAVYSALDIAVLASRFGEGTPNVLAEAMACGVPCVTTDVGDAARVVGDTGRVVPPEDPGALAAACGELLSLTPARREELGAAARARVQKRFGVDTMVDRTVEVLRGAAGRSGRPSDDADPGSDRARDVADPAGGSPPEDGGGREAAPP